MKQFPGSVLSVDVDTARAEVTAHVSAPKILEIARYLHDAPEACFDHITDICSADYPDSPERFEIIYQLLSLPHSQRIRLKARVPEDNPTIDSVTSVWRGAEFLEREVFDMMGIQFTGHPDLRRILLPEDFTEGYPLRKDFPLEGKPSDMPDVGFTKTAPMADGPFVTSAGCGASVTREPRSRRPGE